MRIISQDGIFDVPYEMVTIQRHEEKIYFLSRDLSGIGDLTADLKLAEYSTEDKAKTAMEMLQAAYMKYISSKIMSPEQIAITVAMLSEKEQVHIYGLFKFPQDSEIEV